VSPRRLSAVALACAVIPAGILTGCGGGGGKVDVGPAAAAPANAALYLDATVKPTGSAKTSADQALMTILHTSDPGGTIVSQIDKQKTATGKSVNYQTDIAPWLGQKAGLFLTSLGQSSSGAAVIETTNPGAALAFAQTANGTSGQPKTVDGVSVQTAQDGTTAYATVGDFLLVGNQAGVQAAIQADKGLSLGDQSDFKDAIGNLPSDRLGTFYTVPKSFIDALPPQSFDQQSKQQLENAAGDQLNEPAAGALTATANSVQFEATGGTNGVETPESAVIGGVPSQAWLALGIGNLGDTIRHAIDQLKNQIPNFDVAAQQIQQTTGASLDQLESALGDAAVYVQGTTQNTLSGALVVQVKDVALIGRLLSQLQGLLQLGAGGIKPLNLSGGGVGFQINDASVAARPVEIALQGDKLVIGYGDGSAQQSLAPSQTLGSSQPYSTAHDQISSLGADLFLNLQSIFALAESSGAKSDPQYRQAKPYLNALSYLITGSGTDNDKTEFKAIVGLNK